MAYDPQRNRARAQPAADQPAPVDMVLEGTTESVDAVPVLDVRQEPAAVTVEPIAPPHAHEHKHGPDCDHEHEHDPDLRLIVAAGLATVAATVFAIRRRRASRRERPD